jgi:hypothetical protein
LLQILITWQKKAKKPAHQQNISQQFCDGLCKQQEILDFDVVFFVFTH